MKQAGVRERNRKQIYYTPTKDILIIQLNSILYYLCKESTAARPITDTAQCR
jgi:hypothetical protein